MKRTFDLSYDLACRWWRRHDLERKPESIERVAEVLEEAGIQVYEVFPAGWLSCEPRPCGVREALSGEVVHADFSCMGEFPIEEPGNIIKFLRNKSIDSFAGDSHRS